MQQRNSTNGTFFERLTQALEKSNKKPTDLKSGAGVALSTYYRWRDGSEPHERTSAEVAKFLCVSPDWLLRGVGEMPNLHTFTETESRTRSVQLRGPHTDHGFDWLKFSVDLINRMSPGEIKQVIHSLGDSVSNGDMDSATHAQKIIELIREYRPGIFEQQNSLDP